MRVNTHHSFLITVQSEDALQFNDVVPNINLPYLQTGIVQKTGNNNGTIDILFIIVSKKKTSTKAISGFKEQKPKGKLQKT